MTEMKAMTWNIFHAHDGHPAARPSWRSTVLGTPIDSGTHLHVNRVLVTAVGRILERARPDVAMLQEVPPWATHEIAAKAGMTALQAITAARIGPAALRGWLGRMNPDLVRTHEGNANVLLVRAPWEVVPGSARAVRLNPPGLVRRTARERGMDRRAALDWLWERRNLITARVRHPAGFVVQVACCHCHGDPRSGAVEIPRAGAAVVDAAGRLPAILGGDLNAAPSRLPHAFDGLARRGLAVLPVAGDGIDHILVRGVETAAPARRWRPEEREIVVPWKGGTRRIRVSDHDPVEATLRLRT